MTTSTLMDRHPPGELVAGVTVAAARLELLLKLSGLSVSVRASNRSYALLRQCRSCALRMNSALVFEDQSAACP
jgi:hypothetical protein